MRSATVTRPSLLPLLFLLAAVVPEAVRSVESPIDPKREYHHHLMTLYVSHSRLVVPYVKYINAERQRERERERESG
jgi:hypothetical protein